MRDRWYGDARDLVKWGVSLRLAEDHQLERILQVAYLRETQWASLEIDGVARQLPRSVISHFRRLENIAAIESSPEIDVFEEPFEDRTGYLRSVVSRIQAHRGPQLVLLDPDTGLAPQKRPSKKHVLESELATVWGALRLGDVMALYQHQTNRTGVPWLAPKRRQFEESIGIPLGTSGVGLGPGIAHDVALLFAKSTTSARLESR